MTGNWISAATKSALALAAVAIVSSGAAAQNYFGAPPPQNFFGAPPAQNNYGAQQQNPYTYGAPTQNYYSAPGQNSYSAPAQNLYVYPSQGQSQDQQNRDRYECHNWAVSQTGFDPTRSGPPPTT